MFREDEPRLTSIKFYLETYGCSLNSADSDILIGRLNAIDATRVSKTSDADVLILNTCGVKEPTEDRIIYRLQELAMGPVPVIITGCLPKISLSRIVNAIPNYAAILGPQAIESMSDIVLRVIGGEKGIHHLESTDESKLRWFKAPVNSVICTIPICEGCLGNCTYCAVKFARGRVKSHSQRDICNVVKECADTGYREIRITSQDLGTYGVDINSNLVSLIDQIDKVQGQHKFRLGMINPNLLMDSIDELLEVMKSEHFFKFFHVPLQSGSDTVLKAMERQYSVEEWENIIHTIRKTFADATIATDIIVGFPGETQEDFELTMDVIHRIRPPVVNLSKYGDRPNTIASKSQNKVETSQKKERSRKLTRLTNDILLENNKSWLGWSGPVMVTQKGSRGGLLCRNISYKPVIIKEEVELGKTVHVQLIDAERTHLNGVIISSV